MHPPHRQRGPEAESSDGQDAEASLEGALDIEKVLVGGAHPGPSLDGLVAPELDGPGVTEHRNPIPQRSPGHRGTPSSPRCTGEQGRAAQKD